MSSSSWRKTWASPLRKSRDKVGTVLADLPEDADPPIVEKFDIDATPIATITVSGFRGLKELTEIAENQVKEPLESVTGVGAIDVLGGRKREIQILIDPDRLKAYGLAIRTVAQALAKQNVEFPGGRITQESGETVLRTLGRVKSVREFEDIVVATNDGGCPLPWPISAGSKTAWKSHVHCPAMTARTRCRLSFVNSPARTRWPRSRRSRNV